MAVEIISKLKPINNGTFPIAESNDIQGGFHQVNTVEERDSIPASRRTIGMICYVSDIDMSYQLKGNIENSSWEEYKTSGNGAHISDTEPEDKEMLWIDTDDDDVDETIRNSNVIEEFRAILSELNLTLSDVSYIIKHTLDAGYFADKEPKSEGPRNNPLLTYNDNPFAGSVENIRIKRGMYEDLIEEPIMEGELAFCMDTEQLYIGNKGTKRLLATVGGSSGGSGGSSNVTGEYVMLETPDRQYYRIHLDNSGNMHITHGNAYFENDPAITDVAFFNGLLINHIFGGGDPKKNKSLVSHGFIELYNTTNLKINLKGLSIQASNYQEPWKALELSGIINPKSSFLIRLSELTSKDAAYPRLIIDNYDMDWDITLSEFGYKVYLTIGVTPSSYANPSNINGNNAKAPGYIDLIGVGGDTGGAIDGYAGGYLNVANINTSVHRIDFANTSQNFLDCEAVDWTKARTDIYRPRCLSDGKWDIHYNKIKLADHKPMLINIGFGKDGDNVRTFTWQSKLTDLGSLKYRKINEYEWIEVESTKQLIVHGDTEATGHSVIIKNLSTGIYEYMVGEEGKWSDIFTFEIKKPTQSDTIKFLMVTDQQGFTEYEYLPWKYSSKYIKDNETYDFIINTGDISQNSNKSYEWRYYYEFARKHIASFPHMTTCGNNDLVDKKYPSTFDWYSTYEDSIMPSVYSWNYGYCHFVCLNSNVKVSVNTAEGEQQPTPLAPQLEWLEADLQKPENKKRWTILYMHESFYTMTRNANFKDVHTVCAKYGVDLVLCGHHHQYSRSHGMGPLNADGTDNILSRADKYENAPTQEGEDPTPIDPSRRVMNNGGTVYIMCQATGYKLEGKTAVHANVNNWCGLYFREFHPSYCTFDITYDSISMKAYNIRNMIPMETIFKDPYIKKERDTLVINKTDWAVM